MILYSIVIAYFLDLILGDPQWFRLHPIRLIGKLIQKLEKPLLTGNKKLNGILLLVIVVTITFTLTYFTCFLAHKINIYLWLTVSSFLIYSCISIKDLKDESMEVYKALKEKNISKARQNLSMIVGRDTENLSEKEIIRATVETIAESTVDGIISPLFYAFIGGAPLAIVYKTINTLDSMVGYKTEKYKEFGWASALLDDIANFIPAIISGILIPVSILLLRRNAVNSMKILFRDGIKNLISGIPEAAVAGALQVQLGGLNFYNSIPIFKPLLGDNVNPLKENHIKEAIKIAYFCSALMMILGVILCWNLKLLIK